MRAHALAMLLPALPLAAQLTGDLKTLTSYSVFAKEPARLDFQSWPANTSLAQAQSTLSANSDNGFAATLVSWQVWNGNVITADVSEQGGGSANPGPLLVGTSASTSSASVVQGPHELRLTIRGTAGLRGKVEVWASGIARTGSQVTMAADIGDDSSIELSVAANPIGVFDRMQQNRTLDANGELRVRVITNASAALTSGDTIYKTGISVRFTPGWFCDMGGYGSSCGPNLSGSDAIAGQTRALSFYLSDAPGGAPGVLVLGTQRWSVPLPGGGCLLQTDPIALVSFTSDAFGFAQHNLNVPLIPFAVNLQDVLLAGAQLTSTKGLAIVCQ